MALGTQITGGIVAQTRLAGGITPATKLAGGIRRQLTNPNIVLIQFDDGGAEKFDWQGLVEDDAGHALTPRLNEMRTRGVTFLNGFSNQVCALSRARSMSGQHGFRIGNAANVEDFDVGYSFPQIAGRLILPQALRKGRNATFDQAIGADQFTYAMLHVGKAHLCADTGMESWSVDHGFGRYFGCQPNAGILPVDGSSNIGHFHFTEVTHQYGGSPSTRVWGAAGTWPAGGPYVAFDNAGNGAWDAFLNYRNTISWINSRTQPFFAWVCFNPPHAPFEVPPYTAPDTVGVGATGGTFNLLSSGTQAAMTALNGGGKGPGYEASDDTTASLILNANIEAIDSLIGKLWDRMDPVKRDNCIFVFVGDNGTVAQAVRPPYIANRSKRSPHMMGARVPFVVWGPPEFIGKPGRTSNHLVHIVDVMPTILDLCMADTALWNASNAQKLDGRSFAGVLRNAGASPARTHIYNEVFLPLDGTLGGSVPIDPTTWIRSYFDGEYWMIQKQQGVTPTHELYLSTNATAPASGKPGYIQDGADNLYSLIGSNPTLNARFQALVAGMNAVLAS